MPSRSAKTPKRARPPFTTTIDAVVLDKIRRYCEAKRMKPSAFLELAAEEKFKREKFV